MDIKIEDASKYMIMDALRDTIVQRRKVHALTFLPERNFCIPQLEDIVSQLAAPRSGYDD